MWCDFWFGKIIGSFFFNEVGNAVVLISQHVIGVLLAHMDLDELRFKQDCVLPNKNDFTSREVSDGLNLKNVES